MAKGKEADATASEETMDVVATTQPIHDHDVPEFPLYAGIGQAITLRKSVARDLISRGLARERTDDDPKPVAREASASEVRAVKEAAGKAEKP